jgi:hypothetical protein
MGLMRRWAGRSIVAFSALVAWPVLSAAAASATLSGPCTASGTFTNGFDGQPFTVDASTSVVVEIPRSDVVAWTGAISGVSGERRTGGHVAVDLPWPLGKVTIDTWSDDDATSVSESGEEDYDLPSLVPRGVEFEVTGAHAENGVVVCSGKVVVKVEGSAFDSPLVYPSLGLTAAGAAGLAVAMRPARRAR